MHASLSETSSLLLLVTPIRRPRDLRNINNLVKMTFLNNNKIIIIINNTIIIIIITDEVRRRTGHDGPEWKYKYSSTLSLTSALVGGGSLR